MISRVLRRVIEGILPTRCTICQTVGAGVVCEDCLAQLRMVGTEHCRRCGRQRMTRYPSPDCGECHGQDIGVIATRSCMIYNDTGRQMLADFKYNQRIGAGDALIERTRQWLSAGLPGLYSQPGLDIILAVPVPLHRSRLRTRKFNQAEMIAQRLAVQLGLRCLGGVLLRVRDTPSQVGLSPRQRMLNVQGAFAVPESKQGELRGRDVLLVDDLMTTGATLAACARALRRGGAGAVYGLTLFSTVHEVQVEGV